MNAIASSTGAWATEPLERLVEDESPITYGVVKPGDEDPAGVAFIRGGDIVGCRILTEQLRTITPAVSEQYQRTLLRGGELVVSLVGNPGQVAIVPDTLCGANIARQVGLVRLRSSVDPRYVMYYLASPRGQAALGAHSLGSVQQVINLRDLKTVEVPQPPPSEQRAIAGVLGALDDKIEQNRRTAQAVERLARAIFRAWFVDFEPVKAKVAGAHSFPSMPQPVFDALPTRFVDSNIGPVPQRWKKGAIKDLATLSKTQVKPKESPQEVFDHFSIPAFDLGMRPVVESGTAIKSNKFLVVDGCVLLSKLNPRIPRVWLPPLARGRKQIASTEFLVFVPTHSFDRHYLYCQFKQSAFREGLAQGASGTSNSHQRVRPADVLHRTVIVPPPPIRNGFGDIVGPLFAVAAANHSESATLAQMRDYLLPKLLSGDVRVAADATGSGGK